MLNVALTIKLSNGKTRMNFLANPIHLTHIFGQDIYGNVCVCIYFDFPKKNKPLLFFFPLSVSCVVYFGVEIMINAIC